MGLQEQETGPRARAAKKNARSSKVYRGPYSTAVGLAGVSSRRRPKTKLLRGPAAPTADSRLPRLAAIVAARRAHGSDAHHAAPVGSRGGRRGAPDWQEAHPLRAAVGLRGAVLLLGRRLGDHGRPRAAARRERRSRATAAAGRGAAPPRETLEKKSGNDAAETLARRRRPGKTRRGAHRRAGRPGRGRSGALPAPRPPSGDRVPSRPRSSGVPSPPLVASRRPFRARGSPRGRETRRGRPQAPPPSATTSSRPRGRAAPRDRRFASRPSGFGPRPRARRGRTDRAQVRPLDAPLRGCGLPRV